MKTTPSLVSNSTPAVVSAFSETRETIFLGIQGVNGNGGGENRRLIRDFLNVGFSG